MKEKIKNIIKIYGIGYIVILVACLYWGYWTVYQESKTYNIMTL